MTNWNDINELTNQLIEFLENDIETTKIKENYSENNYLIEQLDRHIDDSLIYNEDQYKLIAHYGYWDSKDNTNSIAQLLDNAIQDLKSEVWEELEKIVLNQKQNNDEDERKNNNRINLKNSTKRVINLIQEVPDKQETRVTIFVGNKHNPGLKKAQTNKAHLIEINEKGEKVWIKNEQVWDKLKDLTEKEWAEYENKTFDRSKNIVANYKVINIKHNWKYFGFDSQDREKEFLGKYVTDQLKQYTLKIRKDYEQKIELENLEKSKSIKNSSKAIKVTGGN